MTEKISVIIPTLNEESGIVRSIRSITAPAEIIVVDGGSTDRTAALVQAMGIRVLWAKGGRAMQMNVGAQAASGDILLFLHGDTRLPPDFDSLVRGALQDPSTIAGAFALRIDAPLWRLRWVERGVQWRSRFLQMPYGDQGIFLRSQTFQQLGGFPAQPIMEDFELVRRLKQLGSIAIVSSPVITSPRRWLQRGIYRTTIINQLMILGYCLGISPQKLAKIYRKKWV